MVVKQQSELHEDRALGLPQLDDLNLESVQLEVTAEPRGIEVPPIRYDLIDVLDEPPGSDQ